MTIKEYLEWRKKNGYTFSDESQNDGTHSHPPVPGIEEVHERAFNLTIPQLDELTRSVGISFGRPPGRLMESKEAYVYMLDEADDIQKVYEYLEKHGA